MKPPILLPLLALALAGCGSYTDDTRVQGDTVSRIEIGVHVWTDAATGCEYLHRTDRSSGLTPRLGADGKPICGVQAKP